MLVGETPPAMLDGNWKMGVFVDDSASGDQVAKLGEVLSGTAGDHDAVRVVLDKDRADVAATVPAQRR